MNLNAAKLNCKDENWRKCPCDLWNRDLKFSIRIGSYLLQNVTIWDFLRSFSVHFGLASQNVLKLILKSHIFIPFGSNLTYFGCQIWDPCCDLWNRFYLWKSGIFPADFCPLAITYSVAGNNTTCGREKSLFIEHLSFLLRLMCNSKSQVRDKMSISWQNVTRDKISHPWPRYTWASP